MRDNRIVLAAQFTFVILILGGTVLTKIWLEASPDLLVNGDIESATHAGWEPSSRMSYRGMTRPALLWDKTVAHSGKCSLKLSHELERSGGQFGVWTALAKGLVPNAWYELSAYVKLQDVGGGGVYLALGKDRSLPLAGTTEGWQRVAVQRKTAEEETTLTVQALAERFHGEVWFDDFVLTKLDYDPKPRPVVPRRPEELVTIWNHSTWLWGVRPFPGEEGEEESVFSEGVFQQDLDEFFEIMQRLGANHVYGLPSPPEIFEKGWGVKFDVERLYLEACAKHGILAFVEGGSTSRPPDSGDRFACRDEAGDVVLGTCLTHPEVREATLAAVQPALERLRRLRARGFPVAGLCTDGLRWRTTGPCQCELCRTEYAQVKDQMTMEQFRCLQVTKIVRALRQGLDEIAPGLLLVGAVKAGNSLAFGQDTPTWLREGLYDYIMPMAYGGPSSWLVTIDYLTKIRGVDPKKIVMLAALYRGGLEDHVCEIDIAKQRGLLGYSFLGWRKLYHTEPRRSEEAPRWTEVLAEAIGGPAPVPAERGQRGEE